MTPRRAKRWLASALVVAQVASLAILAQAPQTALAASGTCATPAKDGSPASLTGIVNTYYPGVATAVAGSTSLTVGTPTGAGTAVATGDLLLIVQMQGASITSTNGPTYGDGLTGTGSTSATAGTYEYVVARGAVSGGALPIAGTNGGGLLHTYTNASASAIAGRSSFQVVRVPQYGTATLASGLTASAWDGTSGGVLAFDTTGTLTLGGTVDLTGLGFRGGGVVPSRVGTGLATDYAAHAAQKSHGVKGEGYAGTPFVLYNGSAIASGPDAEGYPGGDFARGAPGNAGGGGTDARPTTNDQNSGGGGGGNGGAGGNGGNSWSSNKPVGGLGGAAFAASASALVFGGGGGSGSNNDSTNAPAGSSGGPGGGLVLLRAGSVAGSGRIVADGKPGVAPINDGGGGGGAGGSISLLAVNGSGLVGLSAQANGGRGSDANLAASAHGPGGGGAGGVVVTSAAVGSSVVGGAHGLTGTASNDPYGSTSGNVGTTITSASLSSAQGTSTGGLCSIALTVTKSVNATTVARGGSVVYTVTVANAGPGQGDGTTFADAVPAGITVTGATCGGATTNAAGAAAACSGTAPAIAGQNVTSTIPTLPPGTAVTFTISGVAASGATYANSATATPPSFYGVAAASSNVVTTKVAPRVSVTKTASAPTVTTGSALTYTIVVTDLSPDLAANGTVLSDAVPSNFTNVSVTCGAPTGGAVCPAGPIVVTANAFTATVPTLPASGSVTFTVAATASATGTTTNTATIAPASGTSFDPASQTSSSATVTIVTNLGTVNVAIAKSAPAQAAVGGLVAYTIVVTNNGLFAVNGASVGDPVPASLTIRGTPTCATTGGASCSASVSGQTVTATFATLPANATVTLSINAAATASGSYTNTASLSLPFGAIDAVATTSSATTTVGSSAIVKTVRNVTQGDGASGSDLGNPQDVLEYVLTFTNATGATISNFALTDTTPANTTFASVACGTPLPAGISGCSTTAPAVGATGVVGWTFAGALAPGATLTAKLQVRIN